MSTRPLWWCPPGQTRAPWCPNLPCQGHHATVLQTHVARVLATGAGQDWWALGRSEQAAWLMRAREALHDAGPPLGRPRN